MCDVVITSALENARLAESIGMSSNKIIISCKLSKVNMLIDVYKKISTMCDYALHLGLTEAGSNERGVVYSACAIGPLLLDGIGDTIRVSLTTDINGKRSKEVDVAKLILQSLGIRYFLPDVTSCPGCGRTSSDYFQKLAFDIDQYIKESMPVWKKKYSGVENLKISVMGCIVNGPGESKHSDIGISLPGRGENPVAPVYIDGEKKLTLKGEHITKDFKKILIVSSAGLISEKINELVKIHKNVDIKYCADDKSSVINNINGINAIINCPRNIFSNEILAKTKDTLEWVHIGGAGIEEYLFPVNQILY